MADDNAQQVTESAGATAALAENAGLKRTFWQHPFVQNVLPFATSLLLHLGIILLGLATFVTVKQVSSVIKDQIIIPDAELVEGAEVGGVPNPGLGADPNIVSDVKVEAQEQSQKAEERASISVGAIAGDSGGESVIGLGRNAGSLRMGGTGNGDGNGSPFGVPGGSGGLGPRSPFMGVSGNAYRIAYLVDASGSMLVRKDMVVQSLKESVDKLKPVQFFDVIFYHPGGINEIFAKGQLVPATPAQKRAAYEFAEGYQAESNGQLEDPSVALRVAMGMKPQLVYFLTDGFDNGSSDSVTKLRDELKKLNASKEVHVNVIYIADQGQFKQIGGGMDAQTRERILTDLRALAEENGGRFKIVEAD